MCQISKPPTSFHVDNANVWLLKSCVLRLKHVLPGKIMSETATAKESLNASDLLEREGTSISECLTREDFQRNLQCLRKAKEMNQY